MRMNDDTDLYAHESHLLIKDDRIFLMYMSNKETSTERQTTAKAILKVFNLNTLVRLKTFELFYPGLEAGVTLPADVPINVPRMYFYGDDTLRCFCPNSNSLYTRDVNISDSDPDNWTAGNISIAQMTMKDAGGSDVLADVTSANILTHLDYVLGDDYAGYHDLMPMFRNLDIAKDGDTWYAPMEFNSEKSHTLNAPTIICKSTDAGNTWVFGSLMGYDPEVYRLNLVETGVVLLGGVLYSLSRGSSALRYLTSNDGGATWVRLTDKSTVAGLTYLSAKPCLISYIEGATQRNVLAINITSEVNGNSGRTTLAIVETSDFTTFTLIKKIITPTYCHYPSLCKYGSSLYMAYTKGWPLGSATDRNTISFEKIY